MVVVFGSKPCPSAWNLILCTHASPAQAIDTQNTIEGKLEKKRKTRCGAGLQGLRVLGL